MPSAKSKKPSKGKSSKKRATSSQRKAKASGAKRTLAARMFPGETMKRFIRAVYQAMRTDTRKAELMACQPRVRVTASFLNGLHSRAMEWCRRTALTVRDIHMANTAHGDQYGKRISAETVRLSTGVSTGKRDLTEQRVFKPNVDNPKPSASDKTRRHRSGVAGQMEGKRVARSGRAGHFFPLAPLYEFFFRESDRGVSQITPAAVAHLCAAVEDFLAHVIETAVIAKCTGAPPGATCITLDVKTLAGVDILHGGQIVPV